MNKLIKYFVSLSILLPNIASAQYFIETQGIVGAAADIIEFMLIPLAFSLALLFFFWGLAKYIWSVGTEKEEGKKIMVWGVIALFVMSSVWGLVFFIRDQFSISNDTTIQVPTLTQ